MQIGVIPFILFDVVVWIGFMIPSGKEHVANCKLLVQISIIPDLK